MHLELTWLVKIIFERNDDVLLYRDAIKTIMMEALNLLNITYQ